jgi:hypothetical protein
LPVNEFLKITQILTHKSTQFGESESSLAQPARAVAGNGHGVAAANRIGRIRGMEPGCLSSIYGSFSFEMSLPYK